MISEPIRVAHLVSHPIQYFAPLYRELAKREEIDLTVYFYSDGSIGEYRDPEFNREISWGIDLLSGYRSRVLPSARRGPVPAKRRCLHLDIARELIHSRYDVVWMHGYAHASTWVAALAARSTGSRLLLREEQTLLHRRPLLKRVLKDVLLRALFAQVAGLYIGKHNRAYLLRYGVSNERLFPTPYCVDNSTMQLTARELRPQRRALRRSFGINDGRPVILYCGKLIAKKDPLLLLDAFASMRGDVACWLLLVGEGPLRHMLAEFVEARGISNVVMAGFLDQTEISKAYASADVFVLPSRYDETWGLVVNEAMNFSLPVVVTDKVGCAPDLVHEGWNGYIVPAGNAASLAVALRMLVSDAERRAAFGSNSRRLVARHSVAAAADGIVAACLAGRGSIQSRAHSVG